MRFSVVISEHGVYKFYPYTKVVVGAKERPAYVCCTSAMIFDCYSSSCFKDESLPIPKFIMEDPGGFFGKRVVLESWSFNKTTRGIYISGSKAKEKGMVVKPWPYGSLYANVRKLGETT